MGQVDAVKLTPGKRGSRASVNVFNFGSINIDYVYRVPHLVQAGETLSSQSLNVVLGGKGANQSVALARAGCTVVHIGRLGSADAWAADQLREFGVDTSGVEWIDSASGHAIIQVDDNGENSIVLHGGANQSFDLAAIQTLLEPAQPGDWLLIQNECSALEHVFQIAKNQQLNIAFNPAPMTPAVAQLPLHDCRLLFVNQVEAAQLTGADDESQVVKALADRFPDTTIVLTLGAKGAMLINGDSTITVAAPKVDVVDTTGAGDTFVGYYLASIIAGHSAEDALNTACAAGALAVTVAGATPSIPDKSAVAQFNT